MGKLQNAVRDCKGGGRPENRLQMRANWEATIDGEHGIEFGTTIQDFFRQIMAKRSGPRKTRRGCGKNHRGITRVMPNYWGKVLWISR